MDEIKMGRKGLLSLRYGFRCILLLHFGCCSSRLTTFTQNLPGKSSEPTFISSTTANEEYCNRSVMELLVRSAMKRHSTDRINTVAILGGGPVSSTLATLLARTSR